jgi:hypothetical protein
MGVPRTASSNAKQREARCYLPAVDFPRRSGYTERCWTQSGGLCGSCRLLQALVEGLRQGERLQTLPVTRILLR